MTLEKSGPSSKQCSNCQLWFEKTVFPPGRALCRKCHLERLAISVRKWRLKRHYRITPEIYQAMYEDQAGKCFFCNKPPREKERLAVDHDKDTGFVRGLLCQPCNANFIDEYKKLPPEYQDSPRTNAYLLRGETGDYVEKIKQRLASSAYRGGDGVSVRGEPVEPRRGDAPFDGAQGERIPKPAGGMDSRSGSGMAVGGLV